MAWEKRGNNQYYYRKKRIGRHVISEYVGNSIFAELLANQDMLDCKNRQVNMKVKHRQREQIKTIDREIDQSYDQAILLLRAILLLAGYHPHKGQIRRRRDK